jgi:hypothetical protein
MIRAGYSRRMEQDAGVRVQRARPGEEHEVARFEAAFDDEVLFDETRRFLSDEGHHLLLGYIDDQPAGFASAVEILHPTSGQSCS